VTINELCAACGRLSRGFGFQRKLDRKLPRYPACSLACVGRIEKFVDVRGMLMMTDMEKEAIFQARRPFYEALVKIGAQSAFEKLSADQIDSIIAAVWDGLRASMTQQSAAGNIPFPLGGVPTGQAPPARAASPSAPKWELPDDEIPL
jgi:hypothetical protein